MYRRYIVERRRKNCCHGNVKIYFFLFAVVGVGEDVDDYELLKCFHGNATKLSLLHCCRATEYFEFLLTIIRINIPSACVYSCHCYTARKSHLLCTILYCHL